jgi:HlyD family secretion protein
LAQALHRSTRMSSITQAAAPPITPAPARAAAPRKSRAPAILRWGVGLLAVSVLALLGWRYAHSTSAPVVRYQSASVDHGPLAAKVTASGTVSAIVTVQVGSQVSGRIEAWYADFNTPVKKGQLIAQIEPSLFKAAVEQARANYEAAKAGYDKAIANRSLAERSYARALALFEQNLAAVADVDAAEASAGASRADVESGAAAIQQARAALDQTQLNLSYTRIVSPIGGIVISRNIDVGQTVAASFQAPTLFTIAQDLTKMEVDTNVAEGDVGKIHEKMDATFTVDAFPTRTFHGVVRQVRDNATTLQNVVTYDAVIDVDNADLALRPTMTANVTFVYATEADTVRVPNAALRFKPDPATVTAMTAGGGTTAHDDLAVDQRVLWTLDGSRAAPHVVRVGITDGMLTQLAEGDVRAGDRVVSEAIVAGAKKGP